MDPGEAPLPGSSAAKALAIHKVWMAFESKIGRGHRDGQMQSGDGGG